MSAVRVTISQMAQRRANGDGSRGDVDSTADEATFAAAIHQRLLAGDPVATSDLCAHFLPILDRQMFHKWRHTDEGDRADAITDALLDYGANPERFDPAKSALGSYLFMAAHANLKNRYQTIQRREARILHLQPVENDDESRNMELGTTEDFVDDLLDWQGFTEDAAWALAQCETEEERIVARLVIDGAKQTTEFAAALGLAGQPPKAQQAAVFRIKDRLQKRWQRGRKDRHHA